MGILARGGVRDGLKFVVWKVGYVILYSLLLFSFITLLFHKNVLYKNIEAEINLRNFKNISFKNKPEADWKGYNFVCKTICWAKLYLTKQKNLTCTSYSQNVECKITVR